MNVTNDFISLLLNNREKIVDKLYQNYCYDYLIKIFTEINNENNTQFCIEPNDKHVYRYLTGSYKNSLYDKSALNWIPSQELINGILSLALHFGINHIEEIYAGMGILSALLKKENSHLKITSSDTFESNDTCNQLGIVPIARRAPSDFIYYKQLNENYPQMIISSYYPPCGIDQSTFFLEEISNLILTKNHSIIIIILPNTYTFIYDIFYHHLIDREYDLFTYHTKAIDKYFFLSNLMKKQYSTGTLLHILIKKELLLTSETEIDEILFDAIIPTKYIDTHCRQTKWFTFFYDKLSMKLIKSIYRNCDFKKHVVDSKIKKIMDNTILLNKLKLNIPQYIYESDEFLFWSDCIVKRLYFVFNDRKSFYSFYIDAIRVVNEISRKEYNFPLWINTIESMYIYLFFKHTLPDGNWKTNRTIFKNCWKNTLVANIKRLL